MNAHEKQTVIRQRTAALAPSMAPQSLAVRGMMSARGTGDITGALHWPEVDAAANDKQGDFIRPTFWKVGDTVGSQAIGETLEERWEREL